MAAEPLPAVRCVLYTRKSPKTGLAGHEKEDISLENQEEQLRAWVEREGWVVVAVREERHVRYQLKARRVLMQTLTECRRGLYDQILVFNPQRWTGDPKHDNWLDVELEEAGVRVRFLHHDPGEGEFAGVIRYMEGHASQREQSNIVVRTGDGKRKRLEEGLTLPRPQPYGYLWNHQADPASAPRVKLRYDHLVPYPEQARHVPRIFTLLASGQHSGNAVAALLNAEGIPAWGGGRWYGQVVLKMARNPVYKGDDALYRTRRRVEGRGEGERFVVEPTDPSAWRVRAGIHAALVSEELFERAVAAIGTRTTKPLRPRGVTRSEAGTRALLRGGLVVCAGCQRPLYNGGSYTLKHDDPDGAPAGTRVVYYQCSSWNSHGRQAIDYGDKAACPGPASVRADLLDRAAWYEFLQLKTRGQRGDGTAPRSDDPERRLRELDRAMARTRRQVEVAERRAIAHEAAGDVDRQAAAEATGAAAQAMLRALEAEREGLLAAQSAGRAEHAGRAAIVGALTDHWDRLLGYLPWGPDVGDDETMRGLLRAAGVRVEVARPVGEGWRERATWVIAFPWWESRVEGASVLGMEPTTGGRFRTQNTPGPDGLLRALAALRAGDDV